MYTAKILLLADVIAGPALGKEGWTREPGSSLRNPQACFMTWSPTFWVPLLSHSAEITCAVCVRAHVPVILRATPVLGEILLGCRNPG